MYHAELHQTVDEPWIGIEPIRVGDVPTGAGTPGVYVTIERDGAPFARVDAWPLFAGPFAQVVAWKHLVVLGWNDYVHLIDPLARAATRIKCDGYFGHLYPLDDQLLIADASRLISIDKRGERSWTSEPLGIDGVVVDEVRDRVIIGQGEWDPPGRWRPFRLSLGSGDLVAR